MSDIRIRLMEMEDKDRVLRFFEQMAPESRVFFNRNNINLKAALRFFKGTDTRQMRRWIAVDGDEMVGYVFLRDTDSKIPWLGIAVAERMRGKHFGQTLMETAEEWCRQEGKGGILLTTSMANVRAQGLYERCGFERMGIHSSSGEYLYLKRF